MKLTGGAERIRLLLFFTYSTRPLLIKITTFATVAAVVLSLCNRVVVTSTLTETNTLSRLESIETEIRFGVEI